MQLGQRVNRFLLLPLILLGAISCASPSKSPGIHSNQVSAPTSIREEFDSRTLGEDLLLIQPIFRRQDLGKPIAAPAADPALPKVAPTPTEPGEELSPATVYRLQLLTLSNEAAARQLRIELEQNLAVPVHLVTRDMNFMLQAGQYATHSEAARLKEQVTALGSDYADAYVVSLTFENSPDTPPTAPVASTQTPVPTADVPPELVPAFGWRVLIDQFLSHDEARRLKSKAEKRLRRQDVDVTFKAPWYKVEVGHYRTEIQAQAETEKIGRTYPNALKVRSQILVPRED